MGGGRSSPGRRRAALAVGLLVGGLAAQVPATELAAQGAPTPGGAAVQGAFQTRFPDAHRLLVTLEALENVLLQKLLTELQNDPTRLAHERTVREAARGMEHALHTMEPIAPPVGALEREAYDDLALRLQARSTAGTGLPLPTESGRGVYQVLAATHALRYSLLDALAGAGADPTAAVEAAVDVYLARGESGGTVLPRPIAMNALFAYDQAATFQEGYSLLRGFLYASRWFQMAIFEPLIVLETPEEQAAGVQTVIDRFFEKLADPPSAMPTELPMAPTIAPSLLVRSRRAAAVFDNANMLYQATADALLSPLVTDKSAALERALVTFSSPAGTTNDYEWILMANRHGIYNQGGPALGSLEQSERNTEAHMIHRGMVLPGMPGEE